MAVEARRQSSFGTPLLRNRNLTSPISNDVRCNFDQTAYDAVSLPPYGTAGITPAVHRLTSRDTGPANHQSVNISSLMHYRNCNGDYGDTIPSRKRSRDHDDALFDCSVLQNRNKETSSQFSFPDLDVSLQIQQQQLETDRLISLHMERVRFKVEEKRKRQARMMTEAIEQRLMKKLRAREEERVKVDKLNHALDERVRSLLMENQLWRELAQTNAARANALRINLEQALAHVNGGEGLDDDADAQSSCSGERKLAGEAQDKAKSMLMIMCRNCGEEESSVLLLPCRHLCLCSLCGSHVHVCPLCNSPKNASFHVNMSS